MFSLWKARRGHRRIPTPATAEKKRVETIVAQVIRELGLKVLSQVNGRTVLGYGQMYGYNVTLTVLVLQSDLFVAAEARHLRLAAKSVRRAALRFLLTHQNHHKVGSTRLLQCEESVTIVHGMVCDVSLYDAKQIAAMGRYFLTSYEEILTRLYALDYIPHGPLPAHAGDSEGDVHV